MEMEPVFGTRHDHIYCFSVEDSGDGRPGVYVGQGTSAGRALQHFHSHNEKLGAVLKPESEKEWTLSYCALAAGHENIEDLSIMESSVIDVIADDWRICHYNNSRGSYVFRPGLFAGFGEPTHPPVPNAVYMHWFDRHLDGKQLECIGVQLVPPSRECSEGEFWRVTRPMIDTANVKQLYNSLKSIIGNDGVKLSKPYFPYLGTLGFSTMDRFPSHGVIRVRELERTLNACSLYPNRKFHPFIYVQITGDETGDSRSGASAGMTLRDLQDRACKYWTNSSGSESGDLTFSALVEDGSIEKLGDRYPEFLVLCASGSRRVLNVWRVDQEQPCRKISWYYNMRSTYKVIIRLKEPLGADLSKNIIGGRFDYKRFDDARGLNGKAIYWFDVMPPE